jgi:FixJ family two-component response regulator
MRQRWETILKAEGLGELEFMSRSFVPSAAAEHEARTAPDKLHYRDPEALALLREILAECELPSHHRAVLHAFVSGKPLRAIAADAGVSKDTAHRLVLRYLGNKQLATTREVSAIRPAVTLDARRRRVIKSAANFHPSWRPLSQSEAAAAYFELGRVFAEHYAFQWAMDREIWTKHMAGTPRRKIARELGMPDTTVQRALIRVRRGFAHWLRTRPFEREESDHAHISAMFEQFTNHERY